MTNRKSQVLSTFILIPLCCINEGMLCIGAALEDLIWQSDFPAVALFVRLQEVPNKPVEMAAYVPVWGTGVETHIQQGWSLQGRSAPWIKSVTCTPPFSCYGVSVLSHTQRRWHSSVSANWRADPSSACCLKLLRNSCELLSRIWGQRDKPGTPYLFFKSDRCHQEI